MSSALTATRRKDLTPKQFKALTILATGGTQKRAAEVAGVSEFTINKWVKLNNFHREFTRAMERMRYQFEARAIAAGQDGVAVLHKELGNGDVEIRMKAGTALTNAAVRLGTRYKELEVSGALPAPTPMIIFPQNTTMPWNAKPVDVIDVTSNARMLNATAEPEEEPTEEPVEEKAEDGD